MDEENCPIRYNMATTTDLTDAYIDVFIWDQGNTYFKVEMRYNLPEIYDPSLVTNVFTMEISATDILGNTDAPFTLELELLMNCALDPVQISTPLPFFTYTVYEAAVMLDLASTFYSDYPQFCQPFSHDFTPNYIDGVSSAVDSGFHSVYSSDNCKGDWWPAYTTYTMNVQAENLGISEYRTDIPS